MFRGPLPPPRRRAAGAAFRPRHPPAGAARADDAVMGVGWWVVGRVGWGGQPEWNEEFTFDVFAGMVETEMLEIVVRAQARAHTQMHACTRAHTCTLTHLHTYTRAGDGDARHTRTHTHAHTHTRAGPKAISRTAEVERCGPAGPIRACLRPAPAPALLVRTGGGGGATCAPKRAWGCEVRGNREGGGACLSRGEVVRAGRGVIDVVMVGAGMQLRRGVIGVVLGGGGAGIRLGRGVERPDRGSPHPPRQRLQAGGPGAHPRTRSRPPPR